MTIIRTLLLPIISMLSGNVSATLITSLPDGTIAPMPLVTYYGQGPQIVSPTITWTADTNSSFGFPGFGFGSNGIWTGALGPDAGLNSSSGSMKFSFNDPVSAVGGLLNYSPGNGIATIFIFDITDSLLESYILSFVTTQNDTGFFFGFRQSTANIGSFRLSNSFIGITGLTVVHNAPEPASIALVGAALLGMAATRKQNANALSKKVPI